jgi:hypothetical protein
LNRYKTKNNRKEKAMSIKNTVIIPALPDTWQICKARTNTDLDDEGFKQQVIAWAITPDDDVDSTSGFNIQALTALDMILNEETGRQYSCNGKNMNPEPDEDVTYGMLLSDLD